MPRIFDAFGQADPSLDRSRGGLGLGLALVRGLVELHGGEVEARSEGPGFGTEFRVRLRAVGATDPEGPATNLPGTAPATLRRILIIEDHPDSAETLRRSSPSTATRSR